MSSPASAPLSSWNLSHAEDCPAEASAAIPSVVRAVALGLAITVAQVAFVLTLALMTLEVPRGEIYQWLCQWDGHLYARIVRDGYRTTIPPTASIDFETSNVGFFPGYPLLAHSLRKLSGDWLSIKASLAIAAQLAAWGFWTYWLLFLRRFRVPRELAWLSTLAIALHPAGYYLVVAYSESLFLFTMLGFFYWLGDPRGRWFWALPHGIAMSATRLGGLPVAFVPLIAQAMAEFSPAVLPIVLFGRAQGGWACAAEALADCRRQLWHDRRSFMRPLLVGLIASLGGLAFFAYCQWRFGYWNMYFWTQAEGATVSADWFWWLRASSYSFVGAISYQHINWPDDLSRFLVLVTTVLLIVMARWEIRRARAGDRTLPARLPYYLSAAGLFFLHAAGVSPILMQSMFRYALVIHILLLMAFLQACQQSLSPAWLERINHRRFAIAFALLACLQTALLWRYFTHQWVA
jgi:hypothetical protein